MACRGNLIFCDAGERASKTEPGLAGASQSSKQRSRPSAEPTLQAKVDVLGPVEVGKETVYEVQVLNPGSAAATNVRLQIQFPPGLLPKNAQGDARFSLDRQSVVFEPIVSLAPQAQTTFRVTAVAQPAAERDQRVRFAITSDQVRLPIQKEISTLVVPH